MLFYLQLMELFLTLLTEINVPVISLPSKKDVHKFCTKCFELTPFLLLMNSYKKQVSTDTYRLTIMTITHKWENVNTDNDYIIPLSYVCLQHSLIMYADWQRYKTSWGGVYHSVYNKGIVKHNISIWINGEEKDKWGKKWSIYNYK